MSWTSVVTALLLLAILGFWMFIAELGRMIGEWWLRRDPTLSDPGLIDRMIRERRPD